MRIPSGVVDQYIYFVAVDATDLKTRETGLATFTVYRSRNGGAAAAYTTPTINETDVTNMPGVYELLLDEDMTIDAGDDSQEVCLHITHAGMAPVTRTFELYRPKITAGETVTAANGCADADIERLQGSAIATPTTSGVLEVDLTHIAGAAVSATTAQLGVNVVNINNNLSSAQKLQQHYSACASGTSDSGSTTTMVDAARTEADTDYFKDMVILFTSGTLTGQSRRITAFDPATDTVTFAPATTAAVSTQTYIIFQGGTADVAAWLGTAVATPTVAGVPEVDMTHIDGLATAGNNATLNLKQLNVVNSAGTAIVAQGSGTGHGILAEALGSGDGISTASDTGNQISGNITGNLDGNVTGSVATVTTVNGLAANVITAASMAADAGTEIATAVLTTAMTEAYSTDGGTATLAQALYELLARDQESAVSGTTLTVKKRDGTTTAMTFTLDSSTAPTSITRAT